MLAVKSVWVNPQRTAQAFKSPLLKQAHKKRSPKNLNRKSEVPPQEQLRACEMSDKKSPGAYRTRLKGGQDKPRKMSCIPNNTPKRWKDTR